jgi:DNA (cytosine-5)-methyltransferase 1
MATLIETKIGESKGKPRIFLEGRRIAREGISPGDRFSFRVQEDRITITFGEGERTVSKRRDMPVLDIRHEMITLFGDNGRIRVLVTQNRILILKHFVDEAKAERLKQILDATKAGMLRTASLFHGGGVASRALHEGLELSGVPSRISLAVEQEGAYMDQSLKTNKHMFDEHSLVLNCPVQSIRWNRSGIPGADLIEMGIPCLGASTAGRAKRGLGSAEEHPDAGVLFYSGLRAIEAMNPAVVVMENVVQFANTASATIIRGVLSSMGYDVAETTLKGSDYGAFEDRERWLLLATTPGLTEAIDLTDITRYQSVPPNSFAEIQDVHDDHTWSDYTYLVEKESRDIAAGKGFRMQRILPSASRCGAITRGYAKVRSTDPILQREDGKLRLFSPVEHAKAKTIPPAMVDGLSATVAHQILGQSVIYNWFVAMGRVIGAGLVSITNQQPGQCSKIA